MFSTTFYILLIACDCNAIGSVVNDSCNMETGQCQCKENFTGRTCDRCIVCYHRYLIFLILLNSNFFNLIY